MKKTPTKAKAKAKARARKPVARRRAARPKNPRAVKRVVSIPDDVVLSPQTEPPHHMRGLDRSSERRAGAVRELTWAQFDRLVQELARKVSKGGFQPTAVVGVAHGGVFVGGALARALSCEFYPVRISRRSRDAGARRRPKMFGTMPKELKGKRVLVVDDIASSGDTLELACALALKVKARDVKTACLVQRPDGYLSSWCALETDQVVVFPWDYGPVVEDGRFDVDPDQAGA